MDQQYADAAKYIMRVIKWLILDGNLTFSSLHKKLAKIVDDELKKPYEKMDENKIVACECLLWELHSFQTKHIQLGLGKEEGLAKLQETLRCMRNDDM